MLKVRIIPTLLWKNFGLVKGVGFDSWRRVGTILPAVKVYNTRQVDELILVDIAAYEEEREPDYAEVEFISLECFVPLTVGGGIRSVDHVRSLLKAGADKISVNSATYENPELVTEISSRFGAQCVVASIDAKSENGGFQCYSHSGTKPTGKDAVEWAMELEKRGAGEILITSIERDGTMDGYDQELIKAVSSKVEIPVIASGGAGNYEHMLQAINSGASAVGAASIFHFTEQTPLEAKTYLSQFDIPVRKPFVLDKDA
jgi:cyclase